MTDVQFPVKFHEMGPKYASDRDKTARDTTRERGGKWRICVFRAASHHGDVTYPTQIHHLQHTTKNAFLPGLITPE